MSRNGSDSDGGQRDIANIVSFEEPNDMTVSAASTPKETERRPRNKNYLTKNGYSYKTQNINTAYLFEADFAIAILVGLLHRKFVGILVCFQK